MKIISILTLIFTVATLPLNAEEKIELKSVNVMGAENFKQYFNVTKEKFLATPEWDGIAELPLSLKKAIKVAQAEVTNKNPNKKFSVDEVELRKKKTLDGSRWYYIIQFDGDISMKDERVYILLDGSIIHPEIKQQ